jgi:hypothetical protein
MVGERSCLSLIVAGSSTNAALGGVSAGGVGTPELDVTHVVLDHPEGSAGGVTLSKNSERSKIGSHCPSTRSFPSIPCAAMILASSTAAAATRNRQKTSRSRVRMNVRFGFEVTELTVSLANSSRLPKVESWRRRARERSWTRPWCRRGAMWWLHFKCAHVNATIEHAGKSGSALIVKRRRCEVRIACVNSGATW